MRDCNDEKHEKKINFKDVFAIKKIHNPSYWKADKIGSGANIMKLFGAYVSAEFNKIGPIASLQKLLSL